MGSSAKQKRKEKEEAKPSRLGKRARIEREGRRIERERRNDPDVPESSRAAELRSSSAQARRQIILVDLYGGMGTSLSSLSQIDASELDVVHYLYIDDSAVARRAAEALHNAQGWGRRCWREYREISVTQRVSSIRARIRAIRRMYPQADLVITAGPPCADVSRVNPFRVTTRAMTFWRAFERITSSFPDAIAIAETTTNADSHVIQQISLLLTDAGFFPPMALCPTLLGQPMRRDRHFWVRHPRSRRRPTADRILTAYRAFHSLPRITRRPLEWYVPSYNASGHVWLQDGTRRSLRGAVWRVRPGVSTVATVTSSGRAQNGGHAFQVRLRGSDEFVGVPLPFVALGRLFCGACTTHGEVRHCRCLALYEHVRQRGLGTHTHTDAQGNRVRFSVKELRGLFGRSIALCVVQAILIHILYYM